MIKKNIIIFSGAPYSFDEYLKPILFSMFKKYNVHLVQSSFFLNQNNYLINDLENIKKNNINFTYEVFDMPNEKINIKNIRFYMNIVSRFNLRKFEYIFLVNDFSIFDLHIIYHAKKIKIKTIQLFCNTLRKSFFENIKYIDNQNNKIIKKKVEEKKFLKKIFSNLNLSSIIFFINSKFFKLRSIFVELINYKLIPLILLRKSFYLNPLRKHACPQGNCDYTFIFDELDHKLLSRNINKKFILTNHPSTFYKNYFDKNIVKKNKILVLFSCYDKELPQDQYNYWINSLKILKNIYSLSSFDLRFHPRTKTDLKWPKKIEFDLKSSLNLSINIINSNDNSLIQNYSNYILIIGSLSGSLKSLSSYFNGKVLCLLNSNGYYNQKKYLLGSGENIIFIESFKEINKKLFETDNIVSKKKNFIESFYKIDQI